ncbi:calcium-binding protein [Ornithinimicrobium murale]|uniref:calcium-binding protein n=1 Tax=Ornithinimicrobium murale TaxID=1050153 RepID=UPI000E0DBE3F|nr:calcium-binding protein [Ornithinimicrobium murale]
MRLAAHRVLALVATATVLTACANGEWAEGEARDDWSLVFDGHGSASAQEGTVVLEPRQAASADTTHGGLVVTTRDYPADTTLAITARTESQLRQGEEPNPWEVAWVLWNYQDNEHFYAVALKPGGWEITKQDPAFPGNQRFLLTGTEPSFPIGVDYRVEVTQSGGDMTVSVDGVDLGTVSDTERPYTEGAIGLYTEDARVRFTQLTVDAPEL